MSNSNYNNSPGQENYRNRSYNDRSNLKDRSGGRRDGGGFRIRLSDNEMKAVKSIQEVFQLKSTVAVLGFSIRTLSEMMRDESSLELITKYAKSSKNSSSARPNNINEEKKNRTIPDPFARPVKSPSNEDLQSSDVEEDEN